MRAAEAELSLAQSELKLYTVTASIDGEVAWLDVSPGTVTWPGTLIWGEIVDLRELDIRCELSPVQAEQVAVGQSAEVWLDGKVEAAGTGKVVFVGKVADRNSGSVPVVVRVLNAQERLRRRLPSRSASKRKRENDPPEDRLENTCLTTEDLPVVPVLAALDWTTRTPAGPGRRRRGTRLQWAGGGRIGLRRRRAPSWSDSAALGAGGCGITASARSTCTVMCVCGWKAGPTR